MLGDCYWFGHSLSMIVLNNGRSLYYCRLLTNPCVDRRENVAAVSFAIFRKHFDFKANKPDSYKLKFSALPKALGSSEIINLSH